MSCRTFVKKTEKAVIFTSEKWLGVVKIVFPISSPSTAMIVARFFLLLAIVLVLGPNGGTVCVAYVSDVMFAVLIDGPFGAI